jgi:hypothetical protein
MALSNYAQSPREMVKFFSIYALFPRQLDFGQALALSQTDQKNTPHERLS